MTQKRFIKLVIVFYILMVLTTISLFAFNVYRSDSNKLCSYNKNTSFNTGWTDDFGNNINVSSINDDCSHDIGVPFNVYNTIPQNLTEDIILSFRSVYLSFTVYIDDKKVYEYGNEDYHIFGNSAGSKQHSIYIPKEYSGKSICIQSKTSYNLNSERYDAMYINSPYNVVPYSLLSYLPSAMICVFLLSIGIFYVFMDIPIGRFIENSHSMLYLGIFDIIVSIWSLTETRIFDIFPCIAEAITCFTLMLLSLVAIPMGLFLNDSFKIKQILILDFGFILSIINFIMCFVLYLTHIYDFKQTLVITHIVILYFVIFTIYILINNIKDKQKPKSEKILLILGISVMTIAVSTDLILSKITYRQDNSSFTRIGLVIFILLIGIMIILRYIEVMKNYYKLDLISQLAYKDSLTGISNRTAFNEKIVECNSLIEKNIYVSAVMLDINNLKKANDQYGHQQGDILIKGASEVISLAFASIGDIYRIGGDEFAVIICGEDNIKMINVGINNLNKNISKFNDKKLCAIPLSIAFGYSFSNTFNIDTIISNADINMYENKREMKKDICIN